MPRRKKLKLVRPYQDEQSFIEAEGWTLKKSSMLLLDAPDLAVGTSIRCDVSLDSGQTLVRAEGKIVEEVAPRDGRPGGLKLRFQRVAPDTQELIARVLSAAVAPIDSGPAASPGPLAPPDDEALAPDAADGSEGEPRRAQPTEPAPPEPKASDSGLHARVVAPVEAPPNREELLDRLRARKRQRVEEDEGSTVPSSRTGDDAG